jgi:hypothetical protein
LDEEEGIGPTIAELPALFMEASDPCC